MDTAHLAKDFALKERDAHVLYTFVFTSTPIQTPIIQRHIHESNMPDRVMRYGEIGQRIAKWCRSQSLTPTRDEIEHIVRQFDRLVVARD